MSPLARKIYRQLKKHLTAGKPSITYRELASKVGDLHVRSPSLYVALGEITNACRHSDLPALPAIVWRSGGKRPSTGYYKAAHPRAHTEEAQIAAWQREHARVLSEVQRFPADLAG